MKIEEAKEIKQFIDFTSENNDLKVENKKLKSQLDYHFREELPCLQDDLEESRLECFALMICSGLSMERARNVLKNKMQIIKDFDDFILNGDHPNSGDILFEIKEEYFQGND